MLRAFLPLAACLGLLTTSALGADDKGFVNLIGKDLDGWKTNIFGKDDGKTFTVKDGTIIVRGKPAGYIYTAKSYKNYVLKYDWKFPTDGNSGVLVHIQNHGKSWPKSVEVQGMQRDHGHIFAISGAKGKFQTNRENQKKAIKISDWNTTEMLSLDGALSTKINGLQVSSGKADLTEGPFGFQSEGAELHLKNIKIKVLD